MNTLLTSTAAAADLLLLLRHPLGVFLRLHRFHDDRHEAVLLAAQFGALAAIGAGLVDVEPGVAHEAGNGILLDAQRRHPPGVKHVVGGDQYAHLLADGHHQRVVHFQQVVLALGLRAFSICALGVASAAQEADAFAFARQVVVAPFPLVAGGLDGDVRTGGVLHGNDGLGGRIGHANQDEERDDGPDDLDRGAVMEVRRFVARTCGA